MFKERRPHKQFELKGIYDGDRYIERDAMLKLVRERERLESNFVLI